MSTTVTGPTIEAALITALEDANRTGQPVYISYSRFSEYPPYAVEPGSDLPTVRREYFDTLHELEGS